MKVCTLCNKDKNLDCFGKYSKSIDGLFSWCKECCSIYRLNRRKNNLQKHRDYTNTIRAMRIQWFQKLKSNIPCKDCGMIYDPYCMDYDHISDRGLKIKSVSRMVLENCSIKSILNEITKCDLVCLLCHNKRTHIRLNKNTKYRPHQLRNITLINKFKDQPCALCNKKYDHYNMQADHIDPNIKLNNICNLKSRKLTILQNELNKCQVLCALCHRIKSISEQKNKRYQSKKKIKKNLLFYDASNNIKECGICHKIKKSLEFRLNNKTKSGLDTYCKECFNEYRKKSRIIKRISS